jgi:hypothetical protein
MRRRILGRRHRECHPSLALGRLSTGKQHTSSRLVDRPCCGGVGGLLNVMLLRWFGPKGARQSHVIAWCKDWCCQAAEPRSLRAWETERSSSTDAGGNTRPCCFHNAPRPSTLANASCSWTTRRPIGTKEVRHRQRPSTIVTRVALYAIPCNHPVSIRS